MPVKSCRSNGKSGFKWGDNGKCFTGENAKAEATKQGKAIEISKKELQASLHSKTEDILNRKNRPEDDINKKKKEDKKKKK